jgi:hypothetical protein
VYRDEYRPEIDEQETVKNFPDDRMLEFRLRGNSKAASYLWGHSRP